MVFIVPKSVVSVVVIFLCVICEQSNFTARFRLSSWPNLKEELDMMDVIASNTTQKTLQDIHTELNALLVKVRALNSAQSRLKRKRCPGLTRAINSADAVERECLMKIIGIPGLSRYYYDTVMSQLARQIGVEYKEGDVVMLKRLNAQPNFVDLPDITASNMSYPVFLKFRDTSKQTFLNCWENTLYQKRDQEYLNKIFGTKLYIDEMDHTDKIQIHGFRTMNVPLLYKMLDTLSRMINFLDWKTKVMTLYQSRYTKHLDTAGYEQLQTEGIIVKLRTRALKFEWMRHTRLLMLARPKSERKVGFTVHLANHVKYKHRNFTVYIDEHLSTHKRNLFLIARGRCQMKNWLHCWTWDGHIYIRRRSNEETHRIDTFADIDKLIV